MKKNLKFSYNNAPLIIAEISGNHNGSKSRFLKLVKSACINGADLVKIQTYEPEDITLNKKLAFFCYEFIYTVVQSFKHISRHTMM